MSLIFTNTPPDFQPVLADGLFFTLSANTTNTFKFRYVYDLYVNDTLVFQGKATPNPHGLGIVDLQQILETYCYNNPIASWNTTPIYTHTTFPFSRPYYDETISYYVKCGYEYASSELAPISGFTGIGNVQGLPAYTSNVYKTFRSTMGVNGRATQQDFNIDPFVLSGTPSTIDPTTTGLFLTNAPRIQDLDYDEYYTLGFTNYYMGTNMLSEPYYVKYNFYNEQGNLITGTTYENITTNGGGPRTSCNQVYQSLFILNPPTETDYNTLYVGAGPMNIPNIPSGTTQYTVQLFGKFTGETSPIQPTPTPTPTPSPTPGGCNCSTYNVANPWGGPLNFDFIDCWGDPQTLTIDAGDDFNVCSCYGTISAQTEPLTVTYIGACNSPTPTPTPSSTPTCNCRNWQIENSNSGSCIVSIVNCTTGLVQYFTLPGFTATQTCSCSTPTSECSLTITELGACYTPPTTPTPTPSSTPCACGEYEVINEGSNFPVLTYIFCNGQSIALTLYPGYDDLLCGCVGTFFCSDPNVSITYAGPC